MAGCRRVDSAYIVLSLTVTGTPIWRPVAVSRRSHRLDGSGCATRRITGHEMAAGVGIEPTSYTLTACRIALMLTGNKIKRMERAARVELAATGCKPAARPLDRARSVSSANC
jgi:hypothetical protein